jgi:hypothetical protein
MPRAVRFREHRRSSDQSAHLHQSAPEVNKTFRGDVEDEEDSLETFKNADEYGELGFEIESFDLLLPSAKLSVEQNLAPAVLASKELEVRQVQLDMQLQELRRLLRIKASVFIDKLCNSVGQKHNTRSTTKLSSYARRIEDVADRYRASRECLLRLDPDGEWQSRFKALEKRDVRPMDANTSDVEDAYAEDVGDTMDRLPLTEADRRAKQKRKRVRAQSKREYSWIWLMSKTQRGEENREGVATEDEIGEGMCFILLDYRSDSLMVVCRVEYAKAHARARRYSEELELSVEEMRRTLQYLRWKSDWWLSWDPAHPSERVADGRRAYAAKQASQLKSLAMKFEKLWRPLIKELDIRIEW